MNEKKNFKLKKNIYQLNFVVEENSLSTRMLDSKNNILHNQILLLLIGRKINKKKNYLNLGQEVVF